MEAYGIIEAKIYTNEAIYYKAYIPNNIQIKFKDYIKLNKWSLLPNVIRFFYFKDKKTTKNRDLPYILLLSQKSLNSFFNSIPLLILLKCDQCSGSIDK